MQLGFSFSLLLASLLVALSVTDARPTRRAPTMVTLPLKRITQARSDLHPQIFLQQHINRGHKRVARMSGRDLPTHKQLRDNLQKRMFLLDHGPGAHHSKRFNRQGANKLGAQTQDLKLKAGKKTKVAALGGGAVVGAAAAGGAINNAANDGTQAGANSTTGISPAEIQAAQVGGLTAAEPPTAQDSIGLNIEANDVGYVGTVQMGTPPRNFNILMDSGSADLWVGSETCVSEAGGGCGNHQFLGPQSSSSFVDTKKPFSVTYGSGNVAGDIVQDNVVLAGLTLNAHTFGVANQESVDFSGDRTTFDGLMGLAQSSLSQQGVPTPIESLATAGAVPEAITSFKLGRVADGNNTGEVTFGGLDAAKFQANTLVSIPNVNTKGFWEAPMTVSVGGTDVGLQGRTAILDTGTTLIIAPPADAATVHAAIPGSKSDGQGGFTIPCSTNTPVALTFGGQDFAIDPRDLLFAPVDPNNLNGDCVSGISSGQIGGATEWLVGDVFLKNAYFSTDVTKNTVSLAKLA